MECRSIKASRSRFTEGRLRAGPLVFGIGMLFFDGKSVIGWVLTIGGAVIIFVGILVNLQIYFQPTSLYNTVIMLVLLAGGIGLIARSIRPYAD